LTAITQLHRRLSHEHDVTAESLAQELEVSFISAPHERGSVEAELMSAPPSQITTRDALVTLGDPVSVSGLQVRQRDAWPPSQRAKGRSLCRMMFPPHG
jgi:hypothetical protein